MPFLREHLCVPCAQTVLGSGKIVWNPVADQLRASKLKEQEELRESKLRESFEQAAMRTEAFLRDSNGFELRESKPPGELKVSRTQPPAVQCA